MILPADTIQTHIRQALSEDIGTGDATTLATLSSSAMMSSHILAKQDGYLSGIPVAIAVLEECAHHYGAVQWTSHKQDGSAIHQGEVIFTMQGSAYTQLIAERTMLNYLGRMSGIATATSHYVSAIAGTKAKVLDTRKTAPGLRLFDKYAVVCGGGMNHRIGLYDMILIKDNHIDAVGSLPKAIEHARTIYPDLPIEVECRTLDDVRSALDVAELVRIERLMLDNMSLEMMRTAVELVGGAIPLEASGNVSLDRIRRVAETGVEYISVGAITHSASCFDFSMKYTNEVL